MERCEKKSVIAGLYGNALEWYDFLLFASFAPMFSELYFPVDVPFLSLVATFTVFAVGFLVRPIGGAWIGYLADHIGRKKALIVSVSIMTVTTLCIAFLPTYNHLGMLAPLLFTLFRLLQGIAIGGELPGSATFLIEHMSHYGRGFAGSLILCTAFIGIFAGSLTASILSASLSFSELAAWGWRLAYCVGGGLGILGILLRLKSSESPAFLAQHTSDQAPVKQVFSNHRKQLILGILCTSILALGNYTLIAYVTACLVKTLNFTLRDALFINFIALLLLTLLIPLMGIWSDKLGRAKVFRLGVYGLLVGTFPIFFLLMSGHWWYALLSEMLLGVLLAPINATVPTILAEMFPTSVRASGSSIAYNIGQALFGGTAPLIALVLIEFTGNVYAPAWYMFGWAAIMVMACSSLRHETTSFSHKNVLLT